MEVCTTVKIILLAIGIGSAASQSDIVVQTQQGSLRGITLISVRSNKTFFAFMGIPYAKPPLGELRFVTPQPPEPWNDTRDAVIEGLVCPQKNPYIYVYEGAEDCLFLNVYTPQLPIAGGEQKAVMVWIHGGGWHFGSGGRYENGPDYFMDEDVVIVVINYRLGALGFLSLPDAGIPGNNGLKDQVMALRWVQQNIAQFGGDPGNVTIFGSSAGAASVHYHMLSPMSEGLFHRAISQSGSALNPWAFNKPEINHNFSFNLGEMLGYNTSDSQELVGLLRSETPERIVNFTFALREQGHGIPFHPISDITADDGDVFLPDSPSNMVKTGRFCKVPYIVGVNSREGIWELQAIRDATAENTVRLEDILEELEIEMNATRLQETVAEIKRLYFGNLSVSEATLQQHIDLAGDLLIVNGVYFVARKQGFFSAQPVYFYEFSYSGGMSVFKKFVGGDNITGSCHLDDTAYLFHMSRVNQTFDADSSEIITSRRIVKLWTNFAKTRNPTPESIPLLQNVTWSPITKRNFNYLNINTNLTLQHDFNSEKMTFWEVLQNYNTIE